MQDELKRLLEITKDCRPDMHEPDEQDLYAEFGPSVIAQKIGKHVTYFHPTFDNACTHEPTTDLGYSDMGFWLIKRKWYADGSSGEERREWFNLATILALARKAAGVLQEELP